MAQWTIGGRTVAAPDEHSAMYAALPDGLADLRANGRFWRVLSELKSKQDATERNA